MRRFLRLVGCAILVLVVTPASAVRATPTLSVPAPITAEAKDASGADVTYTVTATNPQGHPLTVTCTPPGASAAGTLTATARFPLGVTTVTCNVITDGVVEATASFTVTVRDTTPPAIGPVSTIQVDAAGASGSVVTYTTPSAVDSVDGPVPVACSPGPGSLFAIGSTTVTCTASDSRGNTATATFVVKVVDTTPPPPSAPKPSPAPPATGPPLATDLVPPHEVTGIKVTTARVIRLSWTLPTDSDFDHVEVARSGATDAAPAIVYRGAGSTFTDRGVRLGSSYRYLIATVDHAGNRSAGIAVDATAKLSMLLLPRDGAKTKRPPRLVWRSLPGATYYNVQLFRASRKILSSWPTRTQLRLRKRWAFRGKLYRLSRGTYRWYVWPGLGPRSSAEYGPLLGASSFTITS